MSSLQKFKLIGFKIVYTFLRGRVILQSTAYFPWIQLRKPVVFLSLFSWKMFRLTPHSFVSPVQTITAGSRYTTFMESKHTHFPHVPNVRSSVYTDFFPRIAMLLNRHFHTSASLNTSTINSSSEFPIIISSLFS